MKTFIYTLLTIVLISCYAPKQILPKQEFSLPEKFANNSDTLRNENLARNVFFSDKKLLSLIDTAIRYNWDILSAEQKIKMVDASLLQAKNINRPTLNIGLMASQRKFGLYTMDGAGNISTNIEGERIVPIHLRDFSPALFTTWEADLWGKLKNVKKGAKLRFLESNEIKNLVVTQVVAETAITYYDLFALRAKENILEETIRLQEEAFQLIKSLKESGKVNQLGVDQFEAQLQETKTLSVENRQSIYQTENNLCLYLGRVGGSLEVEGSKLNSTLDFDVNVGLPWQMINNRPDIRAAKFKMMASKADVLVAKYSFRPSFVINGSIGYQAYRTGLLFSTPQSYMYGLFGNFMMPVFNRKELVAQYRFANTTQVDDFINFQKTSATAFTEVLTFQSQLENLKKCLI